jgi:hypothetical protein
MLASAEKYGLLIDLLADWVIEDLLAEQAANQIPQMRKPLVHDASGSQFNHSTQQRPRDDRREIQTSANIS